MPDGVFVPLAPYGGMGGEINDWIASKVLSGGPYQCCTPLLPPQPGAVDTIIAGLSSHGESCHRIPPMAGVGEEGRRMMTPSVGCLDRSQAVTKQLYPKTIPTT